MWYFSPSNSPQGRVSPIQMVASVETDLPTGRVVAAERSFEPDFSLDTIPGVHPARAATAGGPGTEYWLP
ncbi:MAG TPA: hypothetical protein VNY05_00780 [Candidatus Acidoferrales bacterium]|jgi:hypothetical protein|nr:hypothetical protein [Candidatus Acidoferrales bacterium]